VQVNLSCLNSANFPSRQLRRKSSISISLLAIVAAFAATMVVVAPLQAETWTDNTGSFQVEADFLGIRGNDVYLRNESGVTLKVPLDRLNAASQQLARQLAAAQHPAPAAGTDTPDAAATALMQQIEAGNLGAVWDALPASYQSDVNDLVHTFAENMDAQLWSAGATLAQKAARVLKEKKEFAITALMANVPVPVERATIETAWDPLADVLMTLVNSEIADLEKLKDIDVGVFLNSTGKTIADKLAVLAQVAEAQEFSPDQFPAVEVPEMPMPNLAKAKITTLRMDGDTATIRIDDGEKVEDHEVVRVEGKWLPKEMADGWASGIAEAKTAFTTQMPQQIAEGKMMIMMLMTPFQQVLDQLLATETQEQFDQVLQEFQQQMQPPGEEGAPGGEGVPGPAADPFDTPPDGGQADPFGGAPAAGNDPFGN
jgi:hypothetical protein